MVTIHDEDNLREKIFKDSDGTIVRLYLERGVANEKDKPIGETERRSGSFSVETYVPSKEKVDHSIKTLYNIPRLDTVVIGVEIIVSNKIKGDYLNELPKRFPKFNFGEEIKKRVCNVYEMIKLNEELSKPK